MTGLSLTLPIVIVGAVALLALLAAVLNGRPGAQYLSFIADRTREGAAGPDIDREFRLRLAAAAVRRRASEAVLRRPERHMEVIRSIAKEEALQLAAGDRAAGKQFAAWIEGAELSEILYPAAMRAVELHCVREALSAPAGPRDPAFDLDVAAALKVRR